MEKILISACLVGQPVRYDGGASATVADVVGQWHQEGRLVPICPEVSGGLAVPRPAAEIVGGDGEDVLDGKARLRTADGVDVTQAFFDGAQRALAVAQAHQIKVAVLKARSPSCGSVSIYNGEFAGVLRPGQGVTAALLRRHDIAVFSDEALGAAATALAELEGRN